MQKKFIALGCLGVLVVVVLILVGSVIGSYNSLVSLDQKALSQWGQVENVYQRRVDLIPNLVETVKGAAAFEKDTFTAVTEARAKVGQVTFRPPTPRPLPSSSRPRTDFLQPCRA
jgi:LemA protein